MQLKSVQQHGFKGLWSVLCYGNRSLLKRIAAVNSFPNSGSGFPIPRSYFQ